MFSWFKQKPEKTLGQIGEEMAQAHYRSLGFSILQRNYFNKKGKRLGEVDFIAKDNSTLAFVEVKARTQQSGKFGSGIEAVDVFKQQKLLKAVKLFLAQHSEYGSFQPRIDVCAILLDPVDKSLKNVTILVNAVDDWN